MAGLFRPLIGQRDDGRQGQLRRRGGDPGAGGQHGAPFRGRPPRALGACEVWEQHKLGNKCLLVLLSPLASQPRLLRFI